jgi:hypothetical protein
MKPGEWQDAAQGDPDIPEPITKFAQWLRGYVEENQLNQSYTMAHLDEMQHKAREFGVILHEDGCLELVKH